MKGDDKSLGAGATARAAPSAGRWLRHRLPDWPRIWGACLRRIRSWPVPPHCDPRDWRAELDAEGIAAACTAIRNFDPTRGPTLGSFVYHQILSDALARYRQEMSYALRHRSGLENRAGLASSGDEPLATDDDGEQLRTTLRRLVEDDRSLIECLFSDGRTESEADGSIAIIQRAVIKRTQRILQEWRCRLVRSVKL